MSKNGKPEIDRAIASDATERIRGQLQAALTLINDATKRAEGVRPDLQYELLALGAETIRAIQKVNAPDRAEGKAA